MTRLVAGFFIVAMAVASVGRAQTGLCPMSDKMAASVTTDSLEAAYPSVFSHGFELEIADTSEMKDVLVIRAWSNLTTSLQDYLAERMFKWGSPTKIFFRFYFSADGNIEYALTDIKTPGFDHMTNLCMQVREFAKSYHLPLRGTHAFSHCGLVTFKDRNLGVGQVEEKPAMHAEN